MDTKTFTGAVKAAGDADGLPEGTFKALVSVFGNVDSVGDVVMPGAFADSIEAWEAKGDPIPVIWSHDWADPYSHIGHVTKALETDDGLVVEAELDLANPKAEQVYRLLKGRRVTQFSFAYDVVDGAEAERDGEAVYELRKLDVHEVGPCLLGCNQETRLLSAKAPTVEVTVDPEKIAEAVNAAAADALATALQPLEARLDALESPGDETGPPGEPAASDDEPRVAKSPASPRPRPAQVLATFTTDLLKEMSR